MSDNFSISKKMRPKAMMNRPFDLLPSNFTAETSNAIGATEAPVCQDA